MRHMLYTEISVQVHQHIVHKCCLAKCRLKSVLSVQVL